MRRQRTFTLVEMLAAMTIALILVALIIAGSSFAIQKQKTSQTRSMLEQLISGLENHRQDKGYYPQTSGVEEIDISVFQKSSGGYYLDPGNFDTNSSGEILDAWKQEFYYECPGNVNEESFDLWSTGADRTHGDGSVSYANEKAGGYDPTNENDDITNWKQR